MLQEAVNVFKQDSNKAVVIEGYTCAMGTEQYNLGLSGRRANSVKAFLIDKGIGASRLSAKGMGEAKPVADNTTEDGRERNRRVEFHVMQ